MSCNFISQLQNFTRDCVFPEHRLKKGERIETTDGEIPLPEATIQHIQSFMSGREAAGTTILSKSWYNAWLTRSVLDFDIRYFRSQQVFEEFTKETMQRYQKLSLKIDSFRLCNNGYYCCGRDRHAHDLIVGALKMGATTVQIERCSFALPQEVLGSETLLELSLIWCRVDVNNAIRCSRLRSLTLEGFQIRSGEGYFKGLISCCTLLEELSLSNCYDLDLEWTDPFELHKLRRLFLERVYLGSAFYANLSSRFPGLKDLSIVQCYGCPDVHLASNSLETICLQTDKVSKAAKFDVPNIRKFTYSCMGLPSQLSIKGPSREWEFDITIVSNHFHKISWFINLKRLLKNFKLSRISLCIDLCCLSGRPRVDVEVAQKPLVVESLTIDAPSMLSTALVVRSLVVFRPKFMTHRDCNIYAWMQDDKVKSIHILRKRLIQALFASNWQAMFGKFGLKKVNVEIYDKFDAKWHPLRLKKAKADPKAKVRLQLIWNH